MATQNAARPGKRRYVRAVGPNLKKLLWVVLALFAVIAVNSVYLVSVTAAGRALPELVLPGHVRAAPGAGSAADRARGRLRRRPHRATPGTGPTAAPSGPGWPCSRLADLALAERARADARRSVRRAARGQPPGRCARWPTGSTCSRRSSRSGCSSCTGWPAGASGGRSGWRWAAVAVGVRRRHAAAARPGPAGLERRRPRVRRAVLLSVAGAHLDRQLHPGPGARQRRLLPGVPRRRPRRLGAQRPPLQLVQQPALPVQRAGHAPGDDGARRQRPGLALLRRLPRPGAVLQRRLRRPEFDDPEYDLASDATAQAGITCTVCHASPTSTARAATPTTRSTSRCTTRSPSATTRFLRWVNRQLVKAKPEFHKATFLKPLHRTTEFCGTCHKVHLPPGAQRLQVAARAEPLRRVLAQRRLGPGHRAASTTRRRPSRTATAATCRWSRSSDGQLRRPGARRLRACSRRTTTSSPSANTAIPHLLRDRMPDADAAIAAHRRVPRGRHAGRHLRRSSEGGRDRRRAARAAPARGARARAGRDLPARGRHPHAQDGPPLHPGHRRLERGLARRRP